MIKKGAILCLYVAAIVAIIVYKQPILAWMETGDVERFPWMIGTAILLGTVPVVPFGIVAGIMGAQYGAGWGTLISVTSSTVAASLQFLAVRVLFQERGRLFVKKFKRIEAFMQVLEHNAFLAVLTARLLPFVPAPGVNAAAAISRMSFGSFFLATLVGKIPVMIVFSFMGDQLFSSLSHVGWTLIIYAVFLAVVYAGYRWYRLTRLSPKPNSEVE